MTRETARRLLKTVERRSEAAELHSDQASEGFSPFSRDFRRDFLIRRKNQDAHLAARQACARMKLLEGYNGSTPRERSKPWMAMVEGERIVEIDQLVWDFHYSDRVRTMAIARTIPGKHTEN